MISTYELAIKMENEGRFLAAYPLFTECLSINGCEIGDVLFHCGWCAENTKTTDKQLAIHYYLESAKLSCDPVCKMNSNFRAGWIQMHLKNYTDAVELYKKAIETGHSEGEFNSIYSNALYWCAVSLEAVSRFLDAINLYRAVQGISEELNPESRYREIVSLVSIGRYSEAHNLCLSFNQPAPEEFSDERYTELKNLVEKEQDILEYSLNDELNFSN
jgi:tetratricopeptide (TPR) repeat protein